MFIEMVNQEEVEQKWESQGSSQAELQVTGIVSSCIILYSIITLHGGDHCHMYLL